MATIMHLPHEMISIILCQKSIDFEDILNFTFTCKQFYNITSDKVLWRKKFYQRLPDRITEELQLCMENIDFLEQIKASIKSEEELLHHTALMFQTYSFLCCRDNNFFFRITWEDLLLLFDLNKSVYFIIILLKSRLHLSANIFLPYLQRYRLRNIWHTFINYPKEHKLYHEQEILEKVATILTQLYSVLPLEYLPTCISIDMKPHEYKARKILEHFIEEFFMSEFPQHSKSSILTNFSQVSFQKYTNFNDNYWNNMEEGQILSSLYKVLRDKLTKYSGNQVLW